MIRRRFGRTEIQMPIITMGGMRFQKSWGEDKPEDIEKAQQQNVNDIIEKALQSDINHIETARGYGSSEFQLGQCIVNIPREKYILQTKVPPNADPEVFKENFYKSLGLLQVNHIDLLGIHGINNKELLDIALKTCLPIAREFQKKGEVKHIGFSTHGSTEIINQTIATDEFDYVNLHYYYIDQNNLSCIENATKHDMGVFIISPNDKGGRLYDPPQTLCDYTQPYTPMEYNNLFCWKDERIHTLSMGVSQPSDFDHHLNSLKLLDEDLTQHTDLVNKLNDRLNEVLPQNLKNDITTNFLNFSDSPNNVNIHVISRLWSLAKAFDMNEYGKMRYNLIGNGGHWFPGEKYDSSMKKDLENYLSKSEYKEDVLAILEESTEIFKGEEQKRLSSS